MTQVDRDPDGNIWATLPQGVYVSRDDGQSFAPSKLPAYPAGKVEAPKPMPCWEQGLVREPQSADFISVMEFMTVSFNVLRQSGWVRYEG